MVDTTCTRIVSRPKQNRWNAKLNSSGRARGVYFSCSQCVRTYVRVFGPQWAMYSRFGLGIYLHCLVLSGIILSLARHFLSSYRIWCFIQCLYLLFFAFLFFSCRFLVWFFAIPFFIHPCLNLLLLLLVVIHISSYYYIIILIISLAIRQCAVWSSTLITQKNLERRKPRKQTEPPHQVYLLSVPSVGSSTPFAALAFYS